MQYKELIDARTRKGITQAELAEKIGVGRALISKYENGMISPTIAQLQKISDALEVPLIRLIPLSAERYLKTASEEVAPHIDKQAGGKADQILKHIKIAKSLGEGDEQWYATILEQILLASSKEDVANIYKQIPDEKVGVFNLFTLMIDLMNNLSKEANEELFSRLGYLLDSSNPDNLKAPDEEE